MIEEKKLYSRINNKRLREEIKKSQELGEATGDLMLMIYQIAHKITRTRKFFHTFKTSKDWLDDACSDALIKFSDPYYFSKFDLEKRNEDGNLCSPYSFFHTSIKRAIYDSFNNNYYKYFDMKRNLMQFSSCYEETDPYFDSIYDEPESENNGKVQNIDIEDYEKDY